MMDGYGMGSGLGFGGGFMILWWIVIIVAVVALIKWLSASGSSVTGNQEKTALEILNKRYAQGEIDDEEYQRRKRELTR